MYCKHCGKELADEAIMCPACGTPTGQKSQTKRAEQAGGQAIPFGILAFFLASFSFVASIIFGAFLYVFPSTMVLLYVLGATSILPALASICFGIIALHGNSPDKERWMAVTAIVLASVGLFFLFLTGCLMVSGCVYYY